MGLMDASYEYAKLADNYGQFRTPAYKLTVDDDPLQSDLGVESISVTLSLEDASAVAFEVSGAYDLKARRFFPEVKSKLKLGAGVKLSLGYGSALTPLFEGYISSVGANFSDSPKLSITAMDARRLMMEGTSREEVHKVKSYSAAFEEVMQRYNVLCTKLVVDTTPADEIQQITQRDSDYYFIMETLAKQANREFFILGAEAYFRERAKVQKPVTTLTWGEGLMSFSRSSLYQNLKITILGVNPEKKEPVKGEATEKADEAQKAVGPQHETVIPDPNAKEAAKAKKRAEKEAAKRKAKAQSGSGSCVGLPELVPGRFIALKGLDSDLDKDYYIREVRHEFGADGFTTNFEIGGWDG